MNCELLNQNGSVVYAPVVEEGIEWETHRKNSPGKLTFKVLKDDILNIQEGNAVQFKVDGANVFYGYIFKKNHTKENIISVTCYDQLRYFKNKDTYCYTGITASTLLSRICDDFNLSCGEIQDTGYVIPQQIESNKTLFDIVQGALDKTLLNTSEVFVLYDDFGSICLKYIEEMKVGLLIDADTGQKFDYTSSIDEQTYNQVKLTFDNKKTGKRDVYLAKDSSHINEWGILQYYDKLEEGENGAKKAEMLLNYYNKKTRKLTVKDAWGDVRVRAGSAPLISLNLGDIAVNNFMVADKVTHRFKNNEHTMDLTLIGGEFIA
jgi:hypothetical protein